MIVGGPVVEVAPAVVVVPADGAAAVVGVGGVVVSWLQIPMVLLFLVIVVVVTRESKERNVN